MLSVSVSVRVSKVNLIFYYEENMKLQHFSVKFGVVFKCRFKKLVKAGCDDTNL